MFPRYLEERSEEFGLLGLKLKPCEGLPHESYQETGLYSKLFPDLEWVSDFVVFCPVYINLFCSRSAK